ncbi:hypothetical protein JGU66_22755 [Myxococcaceae bacterium JPH2]|nr:hypothetical protein [Myxococcaceae bacterium JPH2]
MAFKLGLSTLALGALLLGSTAASAQDDGLNRWNTNARDGWSNEWSGPRDGQEAFRYDDDDERTRRYTRPHEHSSDCHHGPSPRPVDSRGRYELQTVQRWVPARYEQVWVPEQCRDHGHGWRRRERCRGGYYDQQWVPARYETVQEWVWVPYGGRHWQRARSANYWR